MAPWTINLASNWVNLLHFVAMDIVVILLIFTLSSDLAGRFNDHSLRNGEKRRLFISCPPLIGGGVCCTDSRLTGLMLGIRGCSLLCILICHLCIKGTSFNKYDFETATVLSFGSIRDFTAYQFESATLQRSGCHRPKSLTHTIYGELRIGQHGQIECVTDEDLLINPIILETLSHPIHNLTTSNCTVTKRRTTKNSGFEQIADYRCESATIACVINPQDPEGKVFNDSCSGLVVHHGTTFMCSSFQPNITFNARACQQIINLDWRLDYWQDAFFYIRQRSMVDMIDAMLVAGTETRKVKVKKEVQITQIKRSWVVFAALPLAACFLMTISTFSLSVANCFPVLHDEFELTNLLKRTLKNHSLFVFYSPGHKSSPASHLSSPSLPNSFWPIH